MRRERSKLLCLISMTLLAIGDRELEGNLESLREQLPASSARSLKDAGMGYLDKRRPV